MSSRALPVAALAIGAIVASAASGARPAAAERVTRTADRADALPLLAAEYYGHRRYAVILALENGLDSPDDPDELQPGARVSVPIGARIVTRAGDDLRALAERHLGHEGRAEVLAAHNDLPTGDPLPAGLVVDIPFHVEYTAEEDDETLASVAERYYGDGARAELLSEYNADAGGGGEDEEAGDPGAARLAAGDAILLPFPDVKLHAARRPTIEDDARERARARRREVKRADGALPLARYAWRRGDYERVEAELAPVRGEYLDADAAVEVSLLLGGTALARGDEALARQRFDDALERDPDHEISAYQFSPAIRAVWVDLGGGVDTTSR